MNQAQAGWVGLGDGGVQPIHAAVHRRAEQSDRAGGALPAVRKRRLHLLALGAVHLQQRPHRGRVAAAGLQRRCQRAGLRCLCAQKAYRPGDRRDLSCVALQLQCQALRAAPDAARRVGIGDRLQDDRVLASVRQDQPRAALLVAVGRANPGLQRVGHALGAEEGDVHALHAHFGGGDDLRGCVVRVVRPGQGDRVYEEHGQHQRQRQCDRAGAAAAHAYGAQASRLARACIALGMNQKNTSRRVSTSAGKRPGSSARQFILCRECAKHAHQRSAFRISMERCRSRSSWARSSSTELKRTSPRR